MESVIVYAVLSVLTSIVLWKIDGNESMDVIGFLPSVSLIVLVIGFSISAFYRQMLPLEYSHTETKNLVSVRNDKDINGSFVFGSGSIRTSNYYVGYTDTDKGIKQVKFDAENTYIREFTPGSEKARAEYKYNETKKNWFYKYFVLIKIPIQELDEAILNVPSGTVVYQMRIE